MGKSRELAKNTAIISIGRISTQVINFFLLPLYTVKISPQDYGNYDLIVTLASFIIPVVTMLMEESMFRFLIDSTSEDEKKNVISQAFIFIFSNASMLSIIFWIVHSFFPFQLGFPIWMYCIAMLFISLSNALSRGLDRIFLYSVSNFAVSFLIILLNLVLILVYHLGFDALLISSVIANILASLFVLVKLKVAKYISYRNINKKILKEMLKYSIPLVPNTISWSIINMSDRLVIIGVLGATANGLYSMSYKFPNIINVFYGHFNIAWKESSAEMVRDDNFSELENIYAKIAMVLFSLTLFLICGIRFLYSVFVNVQYGDSVVYVPIIAIGVFYISIAGFYGGIFTAFKKTKILGVTSVMAAIINLGMDLILIRHIGTYAAAVSTLVSSYSLYLFRRIKVRKYVKLSEKFNSVYLFLFIVALGIFYSNVPVLNICAFVASGIFLLIANKGLVREFITTILRRWESKS